MHAHKHTDADWLQISVLCFHKLLMRLTHIQSPQIHKLVRAHTHTQEWLRSAEWCAEWIPVLFPTLCECCSDQGPAAWSMCLLREILFTGINAFYTQASVWTLSSGLLPAGTCEGSLWTLLQALCWCWLVGTIEEKLDSTLFCGKSTLVHISKYRRQADIYNVFEKDQLQLIKTFLMLVAQSVERGGQMHSCSSEGKLEQCPGARSGYLAGWLAGWMGVSLLLP